MKHKKLFSLGMIITIVSFLGFCVENIWIALTKGFMNNRNMILPFLFGYGLAIVAIYLIFGTPSEPRFFNLSIKTKKLGLNIVIFFLIACACVMIGECLLGTFVEKTTGIVWWNYSRLPLHITKYTSIPTTIGFGIMITAFMHFFFTPLYNKFMNMNSKSLAIISRVFILLMTVDFIHSGILMFKTGKLMEIWRIEF